MERRRLLSVLTGAAAGLAGCASAGRPNAGTEPPSPTPTPAAGSVANVDLPVPAEQLERSVRRDGIPAITEPAFGADWSGLELTTRDQFGNEKTIRPRLGGDDRVIGVVRGGAARAYPLRLLNWHEIVNDRFDGPLLVTYCPLCRSGLTAVRRVRGEATVFGVSGQLWRSNLVMYDRLTDSRWAQVAATAIRGPMTGHTLELVPSTITTWGAWREDHPDSPVVLPPPASNTVVDRAAVRDYSFDPYGGYANTNQVGGGSTFDDDRLHPKTLVIGVTAGEAAKAYPLPRVVEAGVVNDSVGDRPVVVAPAPGDTLVAYERTVDGEVRAFEPVDDEQLRADGSRWRRSTGRAVDGPHEGTQLTAANRLPPLFWFAWLDFHPGTALYGGAS